MAVLVACYGLSAPAAAVGLEAAGPSSDPVAAAVQRCRSADLPKERECYTAVLDERLTAGGAAPALELLDGIAALDADVRREGHMYAHRIGIMALTSPADVGRVFATCTPAHQSGCYHGVIQSYFMAVERQGGGVTTQSVDALCGDYRGRRADLLFQCTHGLGHGLAILRRHHLPQALGACDLLTRPSERDMCHAGAFMETIVNATHPHHSPATPQGTKAAGAADHSGHGAHIHGGQANAAAAPAAAPWKALDPRDLHYPCSALDEKYLIACYTMQTSAMLHHTGHDVGRTAAECARAPEKARGTCFLSLGRDVSAIASGSREEAARLCDLSEAAFRPFCHRGVVESLVNMNADPAEGIPYCRVVSEEGSKRTCYTAVGLQALVLPQGQEKREQACRSAEAGFVEACLGRRVPTTAPASSS
jgi:hypothetical protein